MQRIYREYAHTTLRKLDLILVSLNRLLVEMDSSK